MAGTFKFVSPSPVHRHLLHPDDPGLAATLPASLYHGLISQGVAPATALRVSHLPPVGSLFAAFLGYNPMQTLLGPAALSHLPPATAHYLTSRAFFPRLIAKPFSNGLTEAFSFAAGVCALGAVASLLRGGKYHYEESVTLTDGEESPVVLSAQEAIAETEPVVGGMTWPRRRTASLQS